LPTLFLSLSPSMSDIRLRALHIFCPLDVELLFNYDSKGKAYLAIEPSGKEIAKQCSNIDEIGIH
jgi:hypothetical protein